ncbi:MAG: capsular biosynthesis protein [Actinobacteria bacterium]|nr:capsular biosynthesis protein [Actinomycetota bacterium]
MSRSIIIATGFDPVYLRIVEHLTRRELSAGRVPTILLATGASAITVDSFHRGTLKLFGLQYPGHDLEGRLTALGAQVARVDDFVPPGGSARLSADNEALLDIAIEGALITYFRTDKPRRSRPTVARTARNLASLGRNVHHALSSILVADESIELVYVPNGRFPHQKMAQVAAVEHGIDVLHYEKGVSPDSAYLQPYAPQERFASQAAVEPLLSHLSDEEVEAIADEWLAQRSPSHTSTNEFSTLWSQHLPPHLADLESAGETIVGFFTSSQDEFEFLGPEWKIHDWESQFTAFDAIMTKLESQGYRAYLRVHPNLATKSHDCFLRERAGVRWLAERHPDLEVIWHDDTTNTYSLLEVSDAVVVWYSTVGLEASARGLPVWTAAASRYGQVADIKEVLSTSDMKAGVVEPWEVDPKGAKRFVTYLVLRDEKLDPATEQWLPWDAARPPVGARLAGILVAGGAPSSKEAIRSIVDNYRQRKTRSNLLHLRVGRARKRRA